MKIGVMSFAHMHAYSYTESLQRLDDVEIVGIFDDDTERGNEMAKVFDLNYYNDREEFLNLDMDAVIICSENNRHKEMVIAAAKAKKHILCEKPIATNVEDAKEMIQICEENEVILQIAFPVRYSSNMMALKKSIDMGELGDIVAFRTTNRGQNPGGWFIDNSISGGGAVLDHTVHMLDIMRWLINDEVKTVTAVVDSFFHNIETDDAGLLTVTFENGVIASHDTSWSKFKQFPTWGDATIEVIGTKGTVFVDAYGDHLKTFKNDEKALQHLNFGTNMDYELIKDFVNCVKENRQPFITGYDGLKAMEVGLAAYESNERKETIHLS